ncbi:MAG: Cu(I)-responsive transcriptional regulator [Parvibaculum sp.]|nr:Cu(I)-responsive transcriptional regulator [Parvibaculum sp.]|tara:strand:+ start:1022 stop:1441 length:420 start_codon:yes stop_codon:yes gene_type:complete
MNIGELSTLSGVPPKTIRYYEEIDLIPAAARSDNGYRAYTDDAVHTLRFVASARNLGFTVEQCRGLLALYRDKSRASSDVKKMANDHIAEIDRRLDELNAMRRVLSDLAKRCHGDDRPDCPIIDELSDVLPRPRKSKRN